jgi:hypothetical protein
MIKGYVFNPLSGNFDLVGKIPQLDADPASPSAEDVWVKKTQSAGAGGGVIIAPMGLGFIALTPGVGSSQTYELSFRTQEGTTKRVALS